MRRWTIVGAGVAGLLAAALLAGPTAAPGQVKPEKEKIIKELSLQEMRSVLGTPRDDSSGVSDFSLGDKGEVLIAYHYYDVDQDNYETDLASEIGPKLQMLYRKFKSLDVVRVEIETNNPAPPPLWKPFSAFTMDRKTLEKLHWTWFVTRDILEQVLDNEK